MQCLCPVPVLSVHTFLSVCACLGAEYALGRISPRTKYYCTSTQIREQQLFRSVRAPQHSSEDRSAALRNEIRFREAKHFYHTSTCTAVPPLNSNNRVTLHTLHVDEVDDAVILTLCHDMRVSLQ